MRSSVSSGLSSETCYNETVKTSYNYLGFNISSWSLGIGGNRLTTSVETRELTRAIADRCPELADNKKLVFDSIQDGWKQKQD